MTLDLRFLLITLPVVLLAACAAPGEPSPPGCDSNGFIILPTATRPRDPDLFSPPGPPPGGDGADYCPTPVPPEPQPAAYPTQFVTTDVANLSLHVADQTLSAAAFGPGDLTWDGLDIPHTAGDAITWLETGQAQLKGALDGLSDADLAALRPTNWDEMWSTWRIFWTMAAHDLQHGGEIGCLRDLYQLKCR
jgi:hypothetical protein